MGCSSSTEISVRRSQIQLFEADGEEKLNASNKKDVLNGKMKLNPIIYKAIQTQKKTTNMSNSFEAKDVKKIVIKNMTFNIANHDSHKGFSQYRAKNIAKHIAEVNPDIVGFQEIRENSCIKKNQLERILIELQNIQPDFKWYSVWVPSMIYKKAGISTCAEGLGLISRFPIKSFKQEFIPLEKNAKDKNQRSVLFVELEDINLQYCVTHLSYLDDDQIEQTKQLRIIIDNQYAKSETNLKQIILGDFNYHDEEKTKYLLEDEDIRGFKDTAVELNNLQNTWKLYRYDRIYYRGTGLIPVKIYSQEGCSCNDNQNSHCTKHYCSDHFSLTSVFMYEF
ncbi:endonuclease/exonuclease/phosphatase family protein (macronuclear) [Tetrahymena thermophila SB210]|uniref:Endonuclease/exonuclease/phosphatase family protein n=1 Tax=Tetrahymena thermophila (strain SB210) TaxID=312017 RepID=I7M977_TETTS|nr:endonuclease/exonuclease/phosphatase family protein [Tetrahymena thermophila SB210]EAS01061.1 endonuclease/exonuclease/phosphatase family protein [Tetrahymena thermophila SB210]|eukprot:XP_001021306.1 endonuclease/exonuclease/phosphatase family protein [Tetrahymena thermophila SB210]